MPKISIEIQKLLDAVHNGKILTTFNSNEAGTLWEKLWRFKDGKYQSKVCASGVFVDWQTYDGQDSFVKSLKEDIKNFNLRK